MYFITYLCTHGAGIFCIAQISEDRIPDILCHIPFNFLHCFSISFCNFRIKVTHGTQQNISFGNFVTFESERLTTKVIDGSRPFRLANGSEIFGEVRFLGTSVLFHSHV